MNKGLLCTVEDNHPEESKYAVGCFKCGRSVMAKKQTRRKMGNYLREKGWKRRKLDYCFVWYCKRCK